MFPGAVVGNHWVNDKINLETYYLAGTKLVIFNWLWMADKPNSVARVTRRIITISKILNIWGVMKRAVKWRSTSVDHRRARKVQSGRRWSRKVQWRRRRPLTVNVYKEWATRQSCIELQPCRCVRDWLKWNFRVKTHPFFDQNWTKLDLNMPIIQWFSSIFNQKKSSQLFETWLGSA